MEKPNISRREKANAIMCGAIRHVQFERLYGEGNSKAVEPDSSLKITDSEMEKLIIESSEKMAQILEMRDHDPDEYWRRLGYFLRITRQWDASEVPPLPETSEVSVAEFTKWRAAL